MIQELIIFFYLLMLCIIDLKTHNKKHKGIPSFITTIFLLTCIIINPPSILILSASILLSLILYDISWFQGIADLKVLAGLMILLGSFEVILIYLTILIILSILTAWIIKRKTIYPYIILLSITYYAIVLYQYLLN